MLRFKVVKSSFDGMCGTESRYDTIDEALREISVSQGWDSREQMEKAARTWARDAQPGSVFPTRHSAIVAVSIGRYLVADDVCTECGLEGMAYEEPCPVASGDIEQEGSCPHCGYRWNDVFMLANRHVLAKRS